MRGITFDEVLRVQAPFWHVSLGARLSPQRVRVDGLTLDTEHAGVVPLAEITSAFSVSESDPPCVMVRRRAARFVIHVRSPEEGERLLHAIGFSKAQRSTSFRVIARARLFPGFFLSLCFAWMLVLAFRVNFYLLTLAPIFGRVFFFLVRGGRTLLVGSDGVSISRFGRHRFISYDAIESVNRFADISEGGRGGVGRGQQTFLGVALHLKNQENVTLPMTTREAPRSEHHDLLGAYERLSGALADWRASKPSDEGELLRRKSRAAKEWLDSLKKLGTDLGGYRVAQIDRETLARIVEDPAKDASTRAAAALVLRERWTTEERARLDVSAKTTANLKLRIALDRVIEDGEDADLEAALDELASTEPNLRR
ncbi:MAG TPA: hypothetical protein VF407_04025 [Polyangiaceae bacterium]